MERIKWVDKAKGVGIILVVLGHACVPSLINVSRFIEIIYLVIYLFHMPLFIYLSGYTFFNISRIQTFYDLVKKRSKTLLKPYVLYLCFDYLIIILVSIIPRIKDIILLNTDFSKYMILKDILLCEGYVDKHLWYIYLLFFLSVFAFFLKQYNGINKFVIVLCLVFGPIIYSYEKLPVIFHIVYYYPFFLLGKFNLYDWIKTINIRIRITYIILYILFSLFYAYKIQVFKTFGVGLAYIKYIGGFAGIIFTVILLGKEDDGFFSKILRYLGNNSYVIYLLHQPFIVSGTALFVYTVTRIPLIATIIAMICGIVLPLTVYFFYRKIIANARKNC